MILDRPLKEVPTPALYALHRGIERYDGLYPDTFFDDQEPCRVCALGAMGRTEEEANSECFKYGLYDRTSKYRMNGAVSDAGDAVETLAFRYISFSPQEIREQMLRHIVNELRHRGKSIDVKAKELVSIK